MNAMNLSLTNVTETSTATTLVATTTHAVGNLPEIGAAEEEHHSSLTIFFILLLVAICILVVHMLIQTNFHYLPESIAVIIVGAFVGLVLKFVSSKNLGNWQKEEAFPPTIFFLILLPPIIFESGYNLHKGNFFQNLGSIGVFAIVGTFISAMIVGGSVYLLGQAKIAYEFSLVESFAFGSLISAVDPVATLAIFQSLDIDNVLYMLVFGESILNDAIAIVLTTTTLELASPAMAHVSGGMALLHAIWRFLLMFFASAAIGVLFSLICAIILKYLDLRKTPSLEFGLMLVFSYLPYGLAEGLHLSGIMAILFCGITMAHYAHPNLSPVSQITVQQTFRTIAFMAETCVFAYLGLAIFSFKHIVKISLVIWSIVLILVGRAFNIFPLSHVMNYFREHKISRKMQFIMWFSGLRGAIAFALALHLEFEEEKRRVLVTTTLIIVLFTVVFLGGSTLPLMKLLKAERKKSKREVSLSKTKEMGEHVESEHQSELTEDEATYHRSIQHLNRFMKLDITHFIPFFTRTLTNKEVEDGKSQMINLTQQWYAEVRNANTALAATTLGLDFGGASNSTIIDNGVPSTSRFNASSNTQSGSLQLSGDEQETVPNDCGDSETEILVKPFTPAVPRPQTDAQRQHLPSSKGVRRQGSRFPGVGNRKTRSTVIRGPRLGEYQPVAKQRHVSDTLATTEVQPPRTSRSREERQSLFVPS